MAEYVRFFNTGIPVTRCNLHCHYCFYDHHDNRPTTCDESLHFSFSHMRKALSPDRLGGKCMFNLCAAGETLLLKELPELTVMLLELGHMVSIVTNAIPTRALKQLITLPEDFKSRLFVKCSLHYRQFIRLNIIELFFNNVRMIKDAGIAFAVETIANDEDIPLIPEIKNVCMNEVGALCHVAESRNEGNEKFPRLTKLPLSQHQEAWGSFDSPLFDFEQKTYEKYVNQFCYGGEYGLFLDMQTGKYCQCNAGGKIGNLFENIDEPLQFCAVGHNCPKSHCHLSYVWSVLCGCYTVKDTHTPPYTALRDRICKDGSHWLTPALREIYSHQCCEYQEPYPPDKAFYIDMLMRKFYKNKDVYEHELAELVRIVGIKLRKAGVGKAAIYGMGPLGKWLKRILDASEIKVAFAIDKKYAEIDCDVEILPPDAVIPEVDMIIVTAYGDYANIAPMLRGKTDAEIVSIIRLAD